MSSRVRYCLIQFLNYINSFKVKTKIILIHFNIITVFLSLILFDYFHFKNSIFTPILTKKQKLEIILTNHNKFHNIFNTILIWYKGIPLIIKINEISIIIIILLKSSVKVGYYILKIISCHILWSFLHSRNCFVILF